jgi:hypothetical protein
MKNAHQSSCKTKFDAQANLFPFKVGLPNILVFGEVLLCIVQNNESGMKHEQTLTLPRQINHHPTSSVFCPFAPVSVLAFHPIFR